MSRSPLSQIDLNLLVPLEALLREMSVTRAAGQLGVTQSAMSHTLNRLRAHFGDPLLVRRGSDMVKTTLAEELSTDLKVALESAERLLSVRSSFDPARSARRFALIAGDYAHTTVIDPLAHRLHSLAPEIDLIVRSVREPERALAEREYAMMIGPARTVPDSLRRQLLFTDELVCVARRGHPLLDGALGLREFLSATHVLVSPRGLPGGIVDDALGGQGEKRRVLLELPSFLAAAMFVAESDALVAMPSRLALRLAERFCLTTTPLPFETPAIEFVQLWHERHQGDLAHAWLRSQIALVARATPDGGPSRCG